MLPLQQDSVKKRQLMPSVQPVGTSRATQSLCVQVSRIFFHHHFWELLTLYVPPRPQALIDVFNFTRQSVFSEVGCLVIPIGGGDLPRAIMEENLVGTGISGDFHPAVFFCISIACIQGTSPLLLPPHLNSFIPLHLHPKVCRMG